MILKYVIIGMLITVEILIVVIAIVATEGVVEMIREEKFVQRVNQPPPTTLLNNTNQLILHKGTITTLH